MKKLYRIEMNLSGKVYGYELKATSEDHAKSLAFEKLAIEAKRTVWGVKNSVKEIQVAEV